LDADDIHDTNDLTNESRDPDPPAAGARPRRRPRWPSFPATRPIQLSAMLMCWAIALWAQQTLDARSQELLAGVLYAAAAVVFAILVRGVAIEQGPPYAAAEGVIRRPDMFVAGLVLGFGSYVLFDDNRFTVWNLAPWIGGLALCFLALRVPRGSGPGSDLAGPPPSGVSLTPGAVPEARPWWRRVVETERVTMHPEWIILAAIVLVAACLRLYKLDSIPGEKWGDLGFHYGDVQSIWQGDYQIYFKNWGGGREAIFFYLMALLTYFFGFSSFATKFLSVLVGLATIVGIHLWGRELFGRRAGLYAALLLALSKWHLIVSRSSFRASLVPLAACLVGWLFVRAVRRGRAVDWAWAGVAMGVALYTYPSALGLPLAVGAAAVVVALAARVRPRRRHAVSLAIAAVMASIVLVPMARTFLDSPVNYLYRGSIEEPGALLGPKQEGQDTPTILATYADRLRRVLLQYHHEGNSYGYYMVPFERHMGLPDAVLLAFGAAYSVLFWRRGLTAVPPAFMLAMLVPVLLASLPEPAWATNAVRSAGTMAPAYIMAALALVLAHRWLATALGAGWTLSLGVAPAETAGGRRWSLGITAAWVAPMIVAALFALQFRDTHAAYFERYPKGIEWANYPLNLDMARLIQEFEDNGNGQAYIKQWPYWYDIWTVRAAMLDWEWKRDVENLDPLRDVHGKAMILVHPDDEATIEELQRIFPRHVTTTRLDGKGNPAVIVFIGERG